MNTITGKKITTTGLIAEGMTKVSHQRLQYMVEFEGFFAEKIDGHRHGWFFEAEYPFVDFEHELVGEFARRGIQATIAHFRPEEERQ